VFSIDFYSWTPSDWALIACFSLAAFLMLYFALGRPRTWMHDPLGWVIFGYAVTTTAFTGLIAYAIVFEQKVDEPVRWVVGWLMAGALVAKTIAVYGERRKGRIARHYATTERIDPMSTPVPEPSKNEALAAATEIWYKGKRVLRTLVAVVIPALLGFAVVLPSIIEALGLPVDSELRLWLLAVAAGVSAVAAAITRLMAIPAVNAWLIKIGLGSVPKDAVKVRTNPAIGPTVVVTEDPNLSRG
jgi:hypothetical protein